MGTSSYDVGEICPEKLGMRCQVERVASSGRKLRKVKANVKGACK